MHRLRTLVSALACLGTFTLLAGCTLSRPLAQHAVSYNRTVENAQNEMLLLNVVRAKERMPMYFTRIGSITTGVGYTVDSGSLTLSDPVSTVVKTVAEGEPEVTDTRGDTTEIGFPSVSYTNKPTVTISVLDDEEFVKGTLTPVRPETVYFYWQQGWDVDMLIYLLVESIKLGPDVDEKLCPGLARGEMIRNDPGTGFGEFRTCVESFLGSNCGIHYETQLKPIGSPVRGEEVKLADVIDGYEQKLLVETVREDQKTLCSELKREVSRLRLQCPDIGYETELALLGSSERDYDACIEADKDRNAEARKQVDGDPGDSKENGGDDELNRDIEVVFRSPQGVLVYLGEIARAWEDAVPAVPTVCADQKCGSRVPLFVLRQRSSACESALLSAEYGGPTYVVPAANGGHLAAGVPMPTNYCFRGRSMQALTLASQLISLQRKGKDLPGPALVQVVGQ